MDRVSINPGRFDKCFAAAALVAVAMTSPAPAHHSAAMFDATKSIETKGVVKEFLWTNPHSFLVVTARNKAGKAIDYSFEANGPGYLTRNGWKREILKPGDTVTVISHPLRDGRPGGDLVEVTLADGRKLSGRPQVPKALLAPTASDGAER
jgi:hypothetical protein